MIPRLSALLAGTLAALAPARAESCAPAEAAFGVTTAPEPAGAALVEARACPSLLSPPAEAYALGSPPVGPTARASEARAERGRPLLGFISEVRVGALSHDVRFFNLRELRLPDPFSHPFESGMNLNGEVLFLSPTWLDWVGAPRPRLGGSFNTERYTDNAYLDLDWDHLFGFGLLVEGFAGLAWHDGKLTGGNPAFVDLGSRILFHIGAEIGARVRGFGLFLIWEHMSNSGLAFKNQGLDSMGLRCGYRFD